MCGRDVDYTKHIMGLAIKGMRKDKLTISAPASIENNFTDSYSRSQAQKELPNARDMER